MRIIVDTREQRPYAFDNSIRRKLPAGDYSIEGLENRVAIERKSLQDWVNTVLYSKDRFKAELNALRAYDFAAVVIEASLSDILAGDYKSEIKPDALLGITVGIMQAFHPVHVVFAGDRPHAFALVDKMLSLAGERYGEKASH